MRSLSQYEKKNRVQSERQRRRSKRGEYGRRDASLGHRLCTVPYGQRRVHRFASQMTSRDAGAHFCYL